MQPFVVRHIEEILAFVIGLLCYNPILKITGKAIKHEIWANLITSAFTVGTAVIILVVSFFVKKFLVDKYPEYRDILSKKDKIKRHE